MKNVFYGSILVVFFLLSLSISLSIYGKNTRTDEMYVSLSSAVEQSLDNVMTNSNYTITSEQEFVNDFTESLLQQIDSDSTIQINVLEADIEKGLISVEIIEEFKYPNGNTGSVSYNKTAIFDTVDYENEDTTVEHSTITYYIKETEDGEYQEYKKYSLAKGDTVFIAESPEITNATFLYWSDTSGNMVDLTNTTITGDVEYYAVMQFTEE